MEYTTWLFTLLVIIVSIFMFNFKKLLNRGNRGRRREGSKLTVGQRGLIDAIHLNNFKRFKKIFELEIKDPNFILYVSPEAKYTVFWAELRSFCLSRWTSLPFFWIFGWIFAIFFGLFFDDFLIESEVFDPVCCLLTARVSLHPISDRNGGRSQPNFRRPKDSYFRGLVPRLWKKRASFAQIWRRRDSEGQKYGKKHRKIDFF